jgi:hypothetical protein
VTRQLAPFATSRETAYAAAADVVDAAALVTDTITATASGTHATGVALTRALNNITVCATTNDSAVLPLMTPGQMVAVSNQGAATAKVYAYGTGTINGVATDTGVTLAAGKTGVYFAVTSSKIVGGPLG